MKKTILALFIIGSLLTSFTTPLSFAAEGDLLWQRTYSIGSECTGFSVVETQDGGYLIAGNTYSDDHDAFLLKANAQGDSLWSQIYDFGDEEGTYSIIETSDGNYALTGWSNPTSYKDFLLLKLDPAGNIIWSDFYGTSEDDYAFDIIETSDNGLLMVGVGNNYEHCANGGFLWMVKTDADGDSLWSRLYEGEPWWAGRSVIETDDGGFLVVGEAAVEWWWMRTRLVKTDANGDTVWTSILDAEDNNLGHDVIKASDGNFIVVGWAGFPEDNRDALLAKIDSDGNPLWWQTYGGSYQDEAQAVIEADDGNVLFVGTCRPVTRLNCEVYVVKTTLNGDLLWDRSYGMDNSNWGNSILQTSEGNYIITGGISGPGSGEYSICLLCLEGPPTGVEKPELVQPTDHTLVSVFPNPFNPTTEIRFELSTRSRVKLDVFNIDGNRVGVGLAPTRSFPPGHHSITFDGSHLPSGIYFYHLSTGEHTITGKMVLMK